MSLTMAGSKPAKPKQGGIPEDCGSGVTVMEVRLREMWQLILVLQGFAWLALICCCWHPAFDLAGSCERSGALENVN